eukprot:3711984-Pleurochrysis_carterae.AAC.1
MRDMDGQLRKVRTVYHRCSYCKCPWHAPMSCAAIWMPIMSSNARELCSKNHVRAWNSTQPDDK